MSRPKAPCLNCENRHPGCHSECEDYIAYQKANREFSYAHYKSLHNPADDFLITGTIKRTGKKPKEV